MRYGSVCSGIEAASVAWKPLGWEPVFFSEIEKFPNAVLAHRHPGVPNYGDMTKFKEWPDVSIDLLVGGTPCQSFSVAGLRKGLDDPRGNLSLVYLAILDRYRPKWMVWENVPGVLSNPSHDAKDPRPPKNRVGMGSKSKEVETEIEYDAEELHAFNCFLAGLSELGYGWAYRVFDAQYFGVPQRRRRPFVVGYLGDWRRAAAVLFERHSLSGNPPPSREEKENIAPTLDARAGRSGENGFNVGGGLVAKTLLGKSNSSHRDDAETYVPVRRPPLGAKPGSGRRNDLDQETYIPEVSKALNAHPGGARRQDAESETFVADVAGTVNANQKAAGSATQQDAESGLLVSHTLKGEGHDASEDGTGRGVPVIPILEVGKGTTSQGQGPNGSGIGKEGDPMFTLQAQAQHAVAETLRNHPRPGSNSMGATVAFSSKDHGADVGEVAPTLRGMSHDKSHPNAGGQIAVAMQEGQTGCREYDLAGSLRANGSSHDPVGTRVRTGMRVRRLTPRECERLQGLPDDYTLIKYRGKPAADGPRYKAIGNSMAIPCMAWIGKRIQMVEDIE